MTRRLSIADVASSLLAGIRARSAVVAVVGLGAVGGVSARLIAGSGFHVIGVDIDPARIADLQAKLDSARVDPERVRLTTAPAALADADIVIVAVRVAVSRQQTDVSIVRSVLESIRKYARQPVLLLLESTVPPRATRALALECFGEGSVQASLVCHCPERLRVGDDIPAIRATPRLIAGIAPEGTQLGALFLESLGVTPVPATGPEVTELSKLLENTFLTTGIALMGELTRIAHRLGISAREVATAAATKSHGYFPFQPGAGIGGHCLINDLHILQATAASVGVESPMLDGVDHAAHRLTSTVMRRLEGLLQDRHIALAHASVCLVGVGFKPDSADTTNSAAQDVTRVLRSRGASVTYADSLVPEFVVDGEPLERVASPLVLDRADAVLLLSGDRHVDLGGLAHRVPVILDAGGGRVMRGVESRATPL